MIGFSAEYDWKEQHPQKVKRCSILVFLFGLFVISSYEFHKENAKLKKVKKGR